MDKYAAMEEIRRTTRDDNQCVRIVTPDDVTPLRGIQNPTDEQIAGNSARSQRPGGASFTTSKGTHPCRRSRFQWTSPYIPAAP
jgi:hypothetical protein